MGRHYYRPEQAKIKEEVQIGWTSTIDRNGNITVTHETQGVTVFSKAQVTEAIDLVLKKAEYNRFRLVCLLGVLSRSDEPLAQAIWAASKQCGPESIYGFYFQRQLVTI